MPEFIVMDFGAQGKRKLSLYGAGGPIPLPKIAVKGLSDAEKFGEYLKILLNGMDLLFDSFPGMDLVMESATIDSCGADPELIRDIVAASGRDIYFISSRAVKNFKRTYGPSGEDVTPRQKRQALRDFLAEKNVPTADNATDDDLSAAIIWYLATENPARLRKWHYVSKKDKFRRKHRTLRPWGSWNYKGDEPDRLISLLPSFRELPEDMQKVFGDSKNDYCRSRTLPFAQALTEDIAGTREGYEKVLGLYGHGFPSHYRRATEDLRQYIAKNLLTGLRKVDDLSREQHKESLRVTRWYIRRLYHLAQGNQYPAKGNKHPASRLNDQLKGNRDPEEGNSYPMLPFS